MKSNIQCMCFLISGAVTIVIVANSQQGEELLVELIADEALAVEI